MNLGDLRAGLVSLINRDDMTTAQANTFIAQGMQRLQRELRIPSMERLTIWNGVGSTAAVLSSIPIPPNLIQPIDLLWRNDGSAPGYVQGDLIALDKVSFRSLQGLPASGVPRAYGRYQASFYMRGVIPATSELHLYYYGEFSSLVDDTSENEIMASAPDLVTYGALALAGDYFNHPKVNDWEARYGQYRDAVALMAVDIDANGGPMSVASSHGDY